MELENVYERMQSPYDIVQHKVEAGSTLQNLPHSSKTKDSSMAGKICLVCLLMVLLFVSMIIIGVTAAIFTHLKAEEILSNPIRMTARDVQMIFNQTLEIAQRVDELHDLINDQSSSAETENNKILMTIQQNNSILNRTLVETAKRVDELHVFINDHTISVKNDTVKILKISEQNTNLILNQSLETACKVDEVYELINMQSTSSENNTRNINNILTTTGDSVQMLINIVSTLSNIQATSTSTSGVVDNILVVVDNLLELQNGSVLFNSIRPVSCQDILDVHPGSPSGYYHVNSRNIYCNMGELCGSGGGWTRLAYLDMTDATQNCPPGFRLYHTGGVRACGKPVDGASTVSVKYPSNGISYSQVCGRVVAYQYGSPDAVDTRFISLDIHNDLNSYYVDGVSITRGSPRQHVWTLMAGVQDSYFNDGNCPCSNPAAPTQQIQSFIGNNYFCESGNSNAAFQEVFYSSDPLWDGQGCGTQETACCSAPGLPWFHRDYGNTTTTDFLELRVCGDEPDEDVPVSYYEMYVK